VAKGWKAAIADPDTAIASLIERNPAADAALETERLQMAVAANVLTDAVKAGGMGGVDPARMAKAIEQTTSVYTFTNAPDAALYFTPAYLPTDGSLMIE
jgi:NitT/TauT family transport system substrate-binding protein